MIAAHDSLNSLKVTTENNAQQLRAVSDGKQLNHLKTVIAGEQKREKLVSDIGRMVSTFNSIGQIAKNLGVGGDLAPALSAASEIGRVVSNIVSVDYLGAIVGISGLFGGGGKDPAAERHAQLMSYLENKFAEVDKKLEAIIQGQRQIIGTLGKISEQMALYDAVLHDRFDRIEFKLDTIESMTRDILFAPLKDCSIIQDNIS